MPQKARPEPAVCRFDLADGSIFEVKAPIDCTFKPRGILLTIGSSLLSKKILLAQKLRISSMTLGGHYFAEDLPLLWGRSAVCCSRKKTEYKFFAQNMIF